MKVYLAAPYVRKDEINICAAELRAGGVIVTSTWLNEPHASTTQLSDVSPEDNRKYAVQDIKDVQAADTLVFFTDPTKTLVRAGRHVEFGIAVQRHIPIHVVGDDYENIFHYLPNVTHFPSWAALRDFLIAISAPACPRTDL